MSDLLKLTTLFLKLFTLCILGIFLAFPISAICGALTPFLSYLPLIWQILWRTSLGLMMLTVITLFIEGLKQN